ncbi:hypothetical protein NIES25_35490 [Nostoc linckia NIES-25]|nr:hypothetical protein NIES25_35490 [Nostoc linckia NIES-25]
MNIFLRVVRPDALIETSPESLTGDEICRGKLIKSNQKDGFVHKSFKNWRMDCGVAGYDN